jgi:dynein heavy chain
VEETDGIVNALVSKVKAAGLTPDRTNCWNAFITTVKRNLHVVLCFSPVGEDMRTRAKRFPALVNCTVIDWFQPWPKVSPTAEAMRPTWWHGIGTTALARPRTYGKGEDRGPWEASKPTNSDFMI